jgi:autotransporter-associated beta strand protein
MGFSMRNTSLRFARYHKPARLLAFALAALPAVDAQTVITNGTGAVTAGGPGSYIVNSGSTRSHTGVVIALGAASGTAELTVNGTVANTGTNRGIRSTDLGGNVVINIGEGGLVSAIGDDAIQGRNGGSFTLTNLGTLYTGPNINATPATAANRGRGLNVRDVGGGGTIVNGSTTNSTALIRSDGGDAVRIGSNFNFTNYGVIFAAGLVNDSSANNAFNSAPFNSIAETLQASDGFSFEDQDAPGPGATNSTLTNHGSISGARHGVEAGERGNGLTITNQATGTIIGRNGSGVGFDTTTADPTKIVINNHGLIRGDYAGAGNIIDRTGSASPTHDGDGDGIDVDGAATITNFAGGIIRGNGAGGFDTGGRANNSEGIAIGGGVIVNHGLIEGADRGILVNNDAVASRSGSAATSITNHSTGVIEGLNGFAIRLENKHGDARDNDTLVNAGAIIGRGAIPDSTATVFRQNGAADINSTGTLDGVAYVGTGSARFIRGDGSAIQMGEGDDTLTNTGVITGHTGRAINMEGGNDTVNLNDGVVTGSINGGTGSDILNLGAGVSNASEIQNFETIAVASGTATLDGVVSGGALAKTGAGTLVLNNANTYSGGTTLEAGTVVAGHNQALSSGAVTVNSGATLRLGTGVSIGNTINLTGGSFVLAGGSYAPVVAAGFDFETLIPLTSSLGGTDTTATFLDGTTGDDRTLTTTFSNESAALNDHARISDVFSFTGSANDIFVLQIAVAGVDDASFLGWLNGDGLWVNAVEGNTGGIGSSALEGFAGGFGDSGAEATAEYLGSWGYDTANGNVWAVLNHNSDFAAVPEPASFAAVAGGLALFGVAFRRRRSARR